MPKTSKNNLDDKKQNIGDSKQSLFVSWISANARTQWDEESDHPTQGIYVENQRLIIHEHRNIYDFNISSI